MPAQPEFPRLVTRRLVLRRITAQDAPALLDIFGDERVAQFLDGPTLTGLAEAQEIVDWAAEVFRQGHGLRWGITRHDDPRPIGTCGYHRWSAVDARAEIGFDLAPAYWRQGIMTEALRRVLAYGFADMQLNRVQAHVLPSNAASLGLLDSLGFQREGVLRQYRFYRGRYNDEVVLSLLRSEFPASQQFS